MGCRAESSGVVAHRPHDIRWQIRAWDGSCLFRGWGLLPQSRRPADVNGTLAESYGRRLTGLTPPYDQNQQQLGHATAGPGPRPCLEAWVHHWARSRMRMVAGGQPGRLGLQGMG